MLRKLLIRLNRNVLKLKRQNVSQRWLLMSPKKRDLRQKKLNAFVLKLKPKLNKNVLKPRRSSA